MAARARSLSIHTCMLACFLAAAKVSANVSPSPPRPAWTQRRAHRRDPRGSSRPRSTCCSPRAGAGHHGRRHRGAGRADARRAGASVSPARRSWDRRGVRQAPDHGRHRRDPASASRLCDSARSASTTSSTVPGPDIFGPAASSLDPRGDAKAARQRRLSCPRAPRRAHAGVPPGARRHLAPVLRAIAGSTRSRSSVLNATLCLLRGMGVQTVLRDDPVYFRRLLRFWKGRPQEQIEAATAAATPNSFITGQGQAEMTSPNASVIFENARILDGSATRASGDRFVRVEGGRIAEISDRSRSPRRAAMRIDLHGRTLMPGLIGLPCACHRDAGRPAEECPPAGRARRLRRGADHERHADARLHHGARSRRRHACAGRAATRARA